MVDKRLFCVCVFVCLSLTLREAKLNFMSYYEYWILGYLAEILKIEDMETDTCANFFKIGAKFKKKSKTEKSGIFYDFGTV